MEDATPEAIKRCILASDLPCPPDDVIAFDAMQGTYAPMWASLYGGDPRNAFNQMQVQLQEVNGVLDQIRVQLVDPNTIRPPTLGEGWIALHGNLHRVPMPVDP